MVEEEIAISNNISLYPSQTNAVNTYAKIKGYKFISQAYQEIIDNFFTKDDKKTRKIIFNYLVIPALFCLLTTSVNISTDHVFNTLLQNGFYYNDLFILSRAFMILSFGSLGIFVACFYLFYKRVQVEKNRVYYDD